MREALCGERQHRADSFDPLPVPGTDHHLGVGGYATAAVARVIHTIERNRPFRAKHDALADDDPSIGENEGPALSPDAVQTEGEEVPVPRHGASGTGDENDRLAGMEAKSADLALGTI